MSDIFVRLFILDHANRPQFVQETDVHYRSLNGEGLFNWRMKFPLKYHMSKKKLVWEEGGMLARLAGTNEVRMGPAALIVQLWDADTLSPSDFLGYARVDLTKIPSKKKDVARKAATTPYVNLFERHDTPMTSAAVVKTWIRCHGKYDPDKIAKTPGCCAKLWCHCNCLCCYDASRYDSDSDEDILGEQNALPWESAAAAEKRKEQRDLRVSDEHRNRTGKKPKRMCTGRCELELELLSRTEAEAKPAGLAHEAPLPLAEPARPKDSFYALTSPLSSLRYIIWHNYKWHLFFLVLVAIAVGLGWETAKTYSQIIAQRTSDWICFGKCTSA